VDLVERGAAAHRDMLLQEGVFEDRDHGMRKQEILLDLKIIRPRHDLLVPANIELGQ
jgi:hypothetical protein